MVYANDEKHYHTEGNNDLLGARHWGVLSGLQVTENTTPDMNVIVAAGSCIVNATEITKDTSTTVAIDPADATYDRLDIITINDTGTITATAGTPAANPVPPDLPANNILLATILVPVGATAIYNANIYDRRVFIEKIKNVHLDTGIIYDANVATDAAILESKLSFNVSTGHKHDGVLARQMSYTDLSDYSDLELVANKGVANGYASLDANALVPVAQIPDLTRSKITDFWGTPFWDNIPDKPTSFPSAISQLTVDANLDMGSYKLLGVINTRLNSHLPYQTISASSYTLALGYDLQPGETLKVWAVGGLGIATTGYIYAEVYDATTPNTIYSTDIGGNGTWDTGVPLASYSQSSEVRVWTRIRNDDSSGHAACASWSITVE